MNWLSKFFNNFFKGVVVIIGSLLVLCFLISLIPAAILSIVIFCLSYLVDTIFD